MFTGIIRHTGLVKQIQSSGNGKRFLIEAPEDLIVRLEKGITSVSIDGACHTAEDIQGNAFLTYSSFETLSRTTIGSLRTSSRINLELPLTPASLLDGHLVQGHVDGVGQVTSIRKQGEAYLFRFAVQGDVMRYLVEKDSISIDGISLTLFNIDGDTFQVAVIPETAANTSLSWKKEGSAVNIEINIMAKYARKFLIDGPNKWKEYFEGHQ